jgi:hypothetical protein
MMCRLGLLDSQEVRLPLVSIEEEHGKTLDSILVRAGLLQAVTSRAN